ncbi:MAG TPA: hypothetical protein VFS29_08405 [Motilibacteraceae bacterium]|nr:hypothetical protein [Motilibacteraceae bacterium]
MDGLDGPGGGTPRSEPTRRAEPASEPTGLTRREALRRGALVGSALWMVPVAQAVSVTPAAADTASAPGGGGGGGGSRPVTVPPGEAVGRSGSRPGHGPGTHAHPVWRRRRVRHRHGRG